LIEDVTGAEHFGEFETVAVKPVMSTTPDADLVDHPGGRALVEIEHEIGPSCGFECGSSDTFGGGPIIVAGISSIEFGVVDRTTVLANLESEVVGNTDDQDCPGESGGIKTGDKSPDNADTIKFIAIAGGLEVEGLPFRSAVHDGDREPHSGPVAGLTNL